MVCLSVSWSVVSPAKTAEPIKMPFWTRVGTKNHVLDGGADPPSAIIRGGEGTVHFKV